MKSILVAIILALSYSFGQSSVSQDNQFPAPLGLDYLEGLDDDDVVLDVIRNARTVIHERSVPGSEFDNGLEGRVRRTYLSVRYAGQRKLHEARWDLVALANECKGKKWSRLALEVYGALDAIGGAHTYLLGELARFKEHPHRAARALFVLGSRPSVEVNEAANACVEELQALRMYDELQVMNRALGPVGYAYSIDRKVRQLAASGNRLQADKQLLVVALSGYADVHSPGYWIATSALYHPPSLYAKREIESRIKAKQAEVQNALRRLTWHDFRMAKANEDPPDWHERQVSEWKKKLREMFPELDE